MDQGKIYVEWNRPQKYGRFVDTYMIHYGPLGKPFNESQFKKVEVNPDDIKSQVISITYSLSGYMS